MPQSVKSASGRPREARVSDAILLATLEEVAENGVEYWTIAGVAARARTSKQAIYRRHRTKSALLAASLRRELSAIRLPPPLRGSVAGDLSRFLGALCSALQKDPLRSVLRALRPVRSDPAYLAILDEAETEQRLTLRQILIATPFEAEMETRIDLLLGYLQFQLFGQDKMLTEEDIVTAVQLVLGLIAPRDPGRDNGFPGL